MTRPGLWILLPVLAMSITGACLAAVGPPVELPAGFTSSSHAREDVKRRVHWDFDTIEFAYIPAAGGNMVHQHVDGHHWRVAVAALQPTGNADPFIAQYAADFAADGWTILRKQGVFVARKTSGGHDLWVTGSGNAYDFSLELIETAPPVHSVVLQPPQATPETVADDQDLPYAAPLQGSRPQKTVHDHRSIEILLPNAKQTSYAYSNMTRWYEEPSGVSSYEFATLYRKALEAAGWDVVRAAVAGDSVVVAHYARTGRDIWLSTRADGGQQSINVVDYGAETAASALQQQIVREGRVALYGIYFDTDSAVPRPESEATLQNVLQLLKSVPSLKLEVQGHTDNTGAPAHNATLSDARAASVRQWLVGHGVASSRLTSKGYGATVPVADNNTAEGKAKNRRVELVNTAAQAAATVAAPATTSVPVSPQKGTSLVCTLWPAKGSDHPVWFKNTTGRALTTETIINIAVHWKSAAWPDAERDDCFALESDLPANAGMTHVITLEGDSVGKTCSVYISRLHPAIEHTSDGGAITQCDAP